MPGRHNMALAVPESESGFWDVGQNAADGPVGAAALLCLSTERRGTLRVRDSRDTEPGFVERQVPGLLSRDRANVKG